MGLMFFVKEKKNKNVCLNGGDMNVL